ncbi:MAG: hypothetical protein J1F36_05990 [Clostridiales bacterium]|nr:hypothetical protein [Clostridiales bacterium]
MNRKSSKWLYGIVGVLFLSLVLVSCVSSNTIKGVYAEYVINDAYSYTQEEIDKALEKIKEYLVLKGYEDAVIIQTNTNGIRVEIPSVDDPTEVLAIMVEPAKLEMRLGYETPTNLTGDDLDSVTAEESEEIEGDWLLNLNFTADGAIKITDVTSAHVSEQLDFYIVYGNNEERLLSSAIINEPITKGQAYISGSFNQQQAEELANMMTLGKIGVWLELKIIDKIV